MKLLLKRNWKELDATWLALLSYKILTLGIVSQLNFLDLHGLEDSYLTDRVKHLCGHA
jgi:hypothetical protein